MPVLPTQFCAPQLLGDAENAQEGEKKAINRAFMVCSTGLEVQFFRSFSVGFQARKSPVVRFSVRYSVPIFQREKR